MTITNKGELIESLTEAQFNAGLLKFNIPSETNINALNGEGVWGWTTPEDYAKYNEDTYNGKITVILLNQPLNYCGRLSWGDEVTVKCHGGDRPTLDPEWVKEHLQ